VVDAVSGKVREALLSATDALRAAGVESPRLDAELLLAEATGRERASLIAEPEAPLEARAARAFGAMVRRRVTREPVAYILGHKGFRRIELEVDSRCLIPRPETELLVELATELRPRSVLDVGTGSGAVALAVADEVEGCEVVATDTSRAALAIAGANAERLGLADRVGFQLGALPTERCFDLVLANLPYVPSGDWPTLEPEITRWEPRSALLAGEDGLVAIRRLVAALADPEATGLRCDAVGLEVGKGQADVVSGLLGDAEFDVEVRADLAGIDRCVVGRRP
jgi:release factor glutamine methyltransferase